MSGLLRLHLDSQHNTLLQWIGLGKDNWETRRETCKFWNLMHIVFDVDGLYRIHIFIQPHLTTKYILNHRLPRRVSLLELSRLFSCALAQWIEYKCVFNMANDSSWHPDNDSRWVNLSLHWNGILSWCWWNLLTSANHIAQTGSCDRSRIYVPDLGGTGVWPGKKNFHKKCKNLHNTTVSNNIFKIKVKKQTNKNMNSWIWWLFLSVS